MLFSLALSGCQLVPAEGPLVDKIDERAGKSAAEIGTPSATVFDLVKIDARSASLVAAYQSKILNKRFGLGSGRGAAVIGIGDHLTVTVFEAGTDGLFSTVDKKQTSFELVVQPDGRSAIPYVGQVQFAGRTLEQARQTILAALKDKAVQPDVIITAGAVASRSVTVSGAVHSSGLVPIGLTGDQLAEIIAKAGGPDAQPYETYVTLVRGKKVGRVLLKSIIENPSENVYIAPGDQIFVSREPRTFTVLGQTAANNRVEFGANDLNLLEAVALAGGASDTRVDARGYFVFRYEEPEIVRDLLGQQRFAELRSKGLMADKLGRYPIAYQIDMTRPDSLFVGQNFPINSRDVIYVARHPAVDLAKFLGIVRGPLDVVPRIENLAP